MNRYRPYASQTFLYTVTLLLASGTRVREYVRLAGDERESDAERIALRSYPFAHAIYTNSKPV